MKIIRKAIKIMLIAVLFVTAIRRCDKADKWRDTATVSFDGITLTAAEAEEICQNEAEQDDPFLVCFFGEQTATVSCEENGNSASVTLVLTEGNSELLVNGGSELYWLEDGCLIDSDTAWSLFGSTQASGQILWIDGSACTVCGTFESEQPMVIRNASFTDEKVLTAVMLKADSSDNLNGKADQFLSRHGLAGTVISTEYLSAFMRDLLLLVPLILLCRLVRYMTNMVNREKKENETIQAQSESVCKTVLSQMETSPCFARGQDAPSINRNAPHLDGIKAGQADTQKEASLGEKIRWCCYTGIAFLLLFSFIWLALHYFEIPSDMIPTRWSDFSFWSKWWLERKNTILLIWSTSLSQIQINLLWNCLVSMTCTTAASFLALGTFSL